MNRSKTVVVGMSGGVDSSVTALLLKQQGYNVIGMFMKNWEEKHPDGSCRSAQDFEDVVQVCKQLEIPYYVVSFVEEYRDQVFAHFLEELKQGHTPNPDVLCNREIKFKLLYEKALSLGGEALATGHYCQIGADATLLKGTDPNKDQSYFLYAIPGAVLPRVLFPIGHLRKPEVRRIAKEAGLATSEKKDSTGICFIGKRDFKEFLGQYIAYQPGEFRRLNGEVIGQHDGMAFYTIGQRKGMAIGGAGEAWFVVGKDPARNIVYVEQGAEHPALYRNELIATELSWIHTPPPLPLRCTAKVRYRQPEQECIVETLTEGSVRVRFLKPQRAVTPRQSVVFYLQEQCLGGGMISDIL